MIKKGNNRCEGQIDRAAPPPNPEQLAQLKGFKHVRFWVDRFIPNEVEDVATLASQIQSDPEFKPESDAPFLVISGGGSDGAFSAGILSGWSQHGGRAAFRLVTGISTGALIAPFAFLGPDYDETLHTLYTTYSTKDIINVDNPMDNHQLRAILMQFIGEDEVCKIAQAHQQGRRLIIGTTYLDGCRPVAWDVGAIAASQNSEAREFIVNILLASAGEPGVLPPLLFDVVQEGKPYKELHADGGLSRLEFLEPIASRMQDALKQAGSTGKEVVYLLHNSFVRPFVQPVALEASALLSADFKSLFRANGFYAIDFIYQQSLKKGYQYQLAVLPADFDLKPKELFDVTYMRALYKEAFSLASSGYNWQSIPPYQSMMLH